MFGRSAVLLLAASVASAPPAAWAQRQALNCQEADAPKAVVQTVTWRAQDGKDCEVAEILARLGEASRAEPGILAFAIHRSPNAPRDFFLYEQYRDQAAYQAHLERSHFKELVLARAIPLLAQRNRTLFDLTPCPGR